MAEQIWLNGTLVPAADATLSAFDHGLTVGDGIFETLRATDRVVWAPSRHLARLRRSAAILGIEVPYSDDELRAAMQAVLDTHDLALVRVRVTVTAGPGPDRKSVVSGKSVSVRVDPGGRRIIKKKNKKQKKI